MVKAHGGKPTLGGATGTATASRQEVASFDVSTIGVETTSSTDSAAPADA